MVRVDVLQNIFLASYKYSVPLITEPLTKASRYRLDAASYKYAESSDVFVFYPGAGLGTMRKLRRNGGKQSPCCILDMPTSHPAFIKRELACERACTKKTPFLETRCLAEIEEADGILVGSDFSKRTFIEFGVPAQKIRVVGYCSNTRVMSGYRKETSGEVLRVLFVGQITARKGIRYLVDAMKSLDPSRVELLLVGAFSKEFDRSCLNGLPFRCRHLGVLRGESLSKAFAESSVLVLPSVEDGFGLVVPEAMAHSVPVLVSQNAGACELVSDGVGGGVFPARDVEKLASLLRCYQIDSQKLDTDSRDARRKWSENRDSRVIEERLLKAVSGFAEHSSDSL